MVDSSPTIWEEIERSESYLVASMYEEAASLASSVLKSIIHKDNNVEKQELNDMMTSSGMVLVQSLNHLGRASDIVKELKILFTSVDAVPVQVFLSGVCFQISEGSPLVVKEFLEEFLSKWHLVDGRYYVNVGAQIDANEQQEYYNTCILSVDEYIEVVEIYAVMLLGTSLKDWDCAIAWAEKADLPEDRRQGLLRRLRSLCSVKATNSSQGSSANIHDASDLLSKKLNVSADPSKFIEAKYLPAGENNSKQALTKFSKRMYPGFWWFPAINVKFGSAHFVITSGKILLGCLAFLIYYVLRRKRATLKAIIASRILSIKKALVDLWQLMFSYQVNPLAAVQPLPPVTRGG